MQIKINYDDIVTAVRILTSPSEDEFKKWLIKNLGDKYTDDIDTIIVYGTDHKNEVIGKYNICTSSFIEKNKIVAFKRDSFPIQIKPIAPEPSGLIGWQSIS